jgi:hypothetical protein
LNKLGERTGSLLEQDNRWWKLEIDETSPQIPCRRLLEWAEISARGALCWAVRLTSRRQEAQITHLPIEVNIHLQSDTPRRIISTSKLTHAVN